MGSTELRLTGRRWALLRTDERALLVDLLTPPGAGYRLERAVGTTFTMQLESLLRVPLAVVGAEWSDAVDPLGVMEAVRSSADRIDVFCQAGMLTIPSAANALLAFLEPLVHQVRRPRPGHLFHPKVWLASFVHPEQPRRFRLVCGSRNLTSDRAWDVVAALDGVQGDRVVAVNRPLAEFIESLPARVPNGVDPERETFIRALAEAVRSATWSPPDGITEAGWLAFHWLETSRPTLDFASATRRLVISPFLNEAGLATVWPDGECTIVSRPEAFAALGTGYVGTLRDEWGADLYELDDAAAIPGEDDADAGVRWSLRGLHAKVVIFEREGLAHVLIGSANATDAAWSGNTEFMVEVIGPRKMFGVKAALSESDGGLPTILRRWEDSGEDEPEPTKLQQKLEWALVEVASCAFTAHASLVEEDWTQVVRSDVAVPESFPSDATLTVRLLTRDEACHVLAGTPVEASWSNLAPETITPFVVLELTAGPPSSPTRAGCVVMATLCGGPEDRIDRLIAKQVGSPEAFLRFLMLLLQIGGGDETAIAALLAGSGGTDPFSFATGTRGVLEALVTALADHPRSIDEIDHLVVRLSQTEEGRDVLPDGWDDLWPAILEARAGFKGST